MIPNIQNNLNINQLVPNPPPRRLFGGNYLRERQHQSALQFIYDFVYSNNRIKDTVFQTNVPANPQNFHNFYPRWEQIRNPFQKQRIYGRRTFHQMQNDFMRRLQLLPQNQQQNVEFYIAIILSLSDFGMFNNNYAQRRPQDTNIRGFINILRRGGFNQSLRNMLQGILQRNVTNNRNNSLAFFSIDDLIMFDQDIREYRPNQRAGGGLISLTYTSQQVRRTVVQNVNNQPQNYDIIQYRQFQHQFITNTTHPASKTPIVSYRLLQSFLFYSLLSMWECQQVQNTNHIITGAYHADRAAGQRNFIRNAGLRTIFQFTLIYYNLQELDFGEEIAEAMKLFARERNARIEGNLIQQYAENLKQNNSLQKQYYVYHRQQQNSAGYSQINLPVDGLRDDAYHSIYTNQDLIRDDIDLTMSLVREWPGNDDTLFDHNESHRLDSLKYLKFSRQLSFQQAFQHLWNQMLYRLSHAYGDSEGADEFPYPLIGIKKLQVVQIYDSNRNSHQHDITSSYVQFPLLLEGILAFSKQKNNSELGDLDKIKFFERVDLIKQYTFRNKYFKRDKELLNDTAVKCLTIICYALIKIVDRIENRYLSCKMIGKSQQYKNIIEQANTGNLSAVVNYFINEKKYPISVLLLHSHRRFQVTNSQFTIVVFREHAVLGFTSDIQQYFERFNQRNAEIYKLQSFSLNKSLWKIKTQQGFEASNQQIWSALQKFTGQVRRRKLKKKQWNFYLDIETYAGEKYSTPNTIKSGSDLMRHHAYLIVMIDEDPEIEPITFWGDDCVIKFVQYLKDLEATLIEEKIRVVINIWSFNGARFDYLFLAPEIIKNFKDCVIKGSSTLLKVFKTNYFWFKDISLILNSGTSLARTAEIWKTTNKKAQFQIANLSKQQYELQKDEVIKYCIQDCVVLRELTQKFFTVVDEFTQELYSTYIDTSNVFTASSLSFQLYKQIYQTHNLSASPSRQIYDIERSSLYGGITMAFTRKSETAYYYDINSSYPFVMQSITVPLAYQRRIADTFTTIKKENYLNYQLQSHHLYYVKVKFQESVTIPFLPERYENKLFYFQQTSWNWRWGCELKFLLENFDSLVETIEIKEAIEYSGARIFETYVQQLYAKRVACKRDPQKQHLVPLIKLFLNSLYGKFCQKEPVDLQFIHDQYVNEVLCDPSIISMRDIGSQIWRIEFEQEPQLNFIGTLVRISSIITAQARVNLVRGMLNVGMQNVLYCDTDSIVSLVPMSPYMIDDFELGRWKLETKIARAFFLAPKMYCILDDQNKFYGKSKGVRANQTNTWDFWEKLVGCEQASVINNNTFIRKFGSCLIGDIVKLIKMRNDRRQWIIKDDNLVSRPWKNFQHFTAVEKMLDVETYIENQDFLDDLYENDDEHDDLF